MATTNKFIETIRDLQQLQQSDEQRLTRVMDIMIEKLGLPYADAMLEALRDAMKEETASAAAANAAASSALSQESDARDEAGAASALSQDDEADPVARVAMLLGAARPAEIEVIKYLKNSDWMEQHHIPLEQAHQKRMT